jgi:hypothetical protein
MQWRTDLENAPKSGAVIETQCVFDGHELPVRRARWGQLAGGGRARDRIGWVREDYKFWVPTPTRWRYPEQAGPSDVLDIDEGHRWSREAVPGTRRAQANAGDAGEVDVLDVDDMLVLELGERALRVGAD